MDSNIAHTDFDGIDPTIYKRRWLILTTLCLALLGVMLANSSINLALPLMSVDLGLSQSEQTWIVNIYSLLVASLLFLAGACGDRYGRKLALQIGSLVFAASAFYAGFLAHSAIELDHCPGHHGPWKRTRDADNALDCQQYLFHKRAGPGYCHLERHHRHRYDAGRCHGRHIAGVH